ncbi:M61 family metallopeptidase [Pyxidicoccus parkwayensis]|uniref:M61 family metallopeptidase n=1 Tax=Pyxidicoccus parkwayensis TaxID=2813578 RepID=A0ABX7PBT8_9BACT|nr:PDZ domain-containing protein [Pyxidicoccus parkwaysis]QSQ27882.1 M61 family metallopeptidase [Pyxidicoccus parkwaysis]
MSHAVRYRVSMPRPHSHLLEVEATFPAGPDVLDAMLPVWTPGSYLVREFARHVQELSAVSPEGTPLPVRRVDKRTWRVQAGGRAVTLRYRVYANELTVRTSHLDGTHAFFNGACVFLYTEATRDVEHHVTVDPPQGWRAFCALDEREGAFVARDYDTLVDSPFEVGPHTPLTFIAAGVPHEVVVWGDTVPDAERLCSDLQRICESQARMYGGLPVSRYLFLIYLTDKGRGGLEHQASTALLFPRAGLSSSRGWEDLLTLAAHEYFHLWNIKRVKPRALVPFDYSQENYTSLLWAFEGSTAYYDNLFVRRAGLMSAQRYVTRLGETLTALHSTPGRRVQTLAEASLVAWVKHYRPDEHSPNSAISYYLKGEVVSALLDLEIRRATHDVKCLDDVLRLLWQRYGDGSGVPEDGVEAAASEVAGMDLTPFFERALRTTEELDYGVFAHVGLEPCFRPRESANDKGGTPPPKGKAGEGRPKGWLGLTTKGSSTVAIVLEGSPAQEAGLYVEDDVVALDGWKVDGAGLLGRCEDRRPGETVRVTVFRRDRLLEVPVVLGQKPAEAVWLARVERPTDAQKTAFQAWLGAPWDEAPGPT